jgi:hypothetical protein
MSYGYTVPQLVHVGPHSDRSWQCSYWAILGQEPTRIEDTEWVGGVGAGRPLGIK